MQVLFTIDTDSNILFTLFCVKDLRGHNPKALNKHSALSSPLIYSSFTSSLIHCVSLYSFSQYRSLSLFFNFPPPYPLVYTLALRFPPLRSSLFSLSTVDMSAYTARQRRINSQVLGYYSRITASSVLLLSQRRRRRRRFFKYKLSLSTTLFQWDLRAKKVERTVPDAAVFYRLLGSHNLTALLRELSQ